jgi:DNA replication protein DnaD
MAAINSINSPVKYMAAILDNWLEANVFDLDSLEKYELEYKNTKKSHTDILNGKTQNTKTNKFLSFPQTKYNFEEIEQLEMKRQIEKLKREGIIPEDKNKL